MGNERLRHLIERRSRVMTAMLLARIIALPSVDDMIAKGVEAFPDILCNELDAFISDIEDECNCSMDGLVMMAADDRASESEAKAS
jgi:hypothetical protein